MDIPDAITRADAKEDDTITLREKGIEKVEKTIIKEIDGAKVRSVEMVDRRVWEAEVVSEKSQQTSEVEASSSSRSVVEQKGQVKEADASTTEPAAQQISRLQELEQEQQAKRDQSEQER